MRISNVTKTQNCKDNGFLTYDIIEQAQCVVDRLSRMFKILKFGIVEDGKVFHVIKL